MQSNVKIPPDVPASPIKIEDLPMEDGKEADVKGGPIYMPIQGVDGEFRPRRP